MYIHLGQDVVVHTDSIIGIFDMDNTTSSYITREFLKVAQKDGNIVNVSEDLPKSFVICEDGKNTVYLSQLSSATLLKRNNTGSILNLGWYKNQEAIVDVEHRKD